MKMGSRPDQMMDEHLILIPEVKLREPVIDIQNRFKIKFEQHGSRFSA